MSYIVLALCLLVLFVIAFTLFGNDFFAPPCLFAVVFFLVSLLSYVGCSSWNDVEIGTTTTLIITLGCLCVIVGGYLVYRVLARKPVSEFEKFTTEQFVNYRVKSWKLVVALAITAVSAVLRIREMRTIGGAKATDFSDLIRRTRLATSSLFNDADELQSFSTLVIQTSRIVMAIGLVAAVYVVICFKRKNDWVQKILSLLCVLGPCAYFLLTGSRGTSLGILLAVLLAWGIIKLRLGHSTAKSSAKLLRKIAVAVAVLLPVFYVSVPLLGREAKGGFSEYLSFYFGAGLPSLEAKLQQGGDLTPEIPFFNTFYGVNSALSKLGGYSLPAYGDDWVTFGEHKSNIYTCFYRFFADAGMTGVVIFSLLSGALYVALYQAAIRVPSVFIVPFWLNIARTMLDVGRDETLLGHQVTSVYFYNISFYILLFSIFFFGWLVFPKHSRELKAEFATREDDSAQDQQQLGAGAPKRRRARRRGRQRQRSAIVTVARHRS